MKRFTKPRMSIAIRLMGLFALLLVAFSVIQSLLFNTLMRSQMIRHYSQSMQRDAHAIAQNLSELIAPSVYDRLDETRFIVSEDTLGAYLSMTELLTNSNVYLVDTGHNITGHFSGVVQTLENPLLPAYLEQTIALGFMGKTPFIQSEYDGELHLTASMPIMNAHSQVLGVVVLESTLREMGYTQVSSITILITSCVISFVLSALLAVAFSGLFTRPISRLEQVALALAAGKYETRTRVKKRDEIGSLAQSMDVLAVRLEEARRQELKHQEQQQRLFSNISHELRTPVTVIRGSLEALRDGVVHSEQEVRAYYEQMIRESRWLQRLIRDLLELSRLQNAEYMLDCQSFDLCDLLGDVAMSTRAMCEAKGIVFDCAEPEASYAFEGDYTRLRQMLLAVADNAVKFTSPGHGVHMRLDSSQQPVIVIADEGVGIAQDELAHIFDRFHATRDSSHDSTGLGLAIVQEIARRHDIAIGVESTIGKGTTFTFTFPRKP